MNNRTCSTCSAEFSPRHSRQIYCASKCRPRPRVMIEKTCDWCGETCLKERRQQRYSGTYCGQTCRDYARRIDGEGSCPIPEGHWARWYGATSAWVAPDPVKPGFVSNACDDCGTAFIEANHGTPSTYCSPRCARRVAKRARRAREHGAPGQFTHTQLINQYIRQNRACAYCKMPCIGLPDPDHVLPLSRGGRNDMSNIVASCRACNTDKNDLTLDEWAESRALRSLTVLDTSLTGREFINLMRSAPNKQSWRDRVA